MSNLHNIPSELLETFESLNTEEQESLLKLPSDMRLTMLRIANKERRDPAVQTASRMRNAIEPGHEQLVLPMAPLPTDLARVSPFFPLAKKDMTKREYLRKEVIADHAWGKLEYSGPKLSIYEEDVLLALISIMQKGVNTRVDPTADGGQTYTYQGPISPIIEVMGLSEAGEIYAKIIRSLELMTGAVMTMTVGKKKGERLQQFSSIMSGGLWDEKTRTLTVSINSYFLQMYITGSITWLDVRLRTRLTSTNAKALYRFVASHRDDEWRGGMMHVAAAINLDLTLPKFKIRERLRGAISDLVDESVLKPESNLKGDILTLIRVARSRRMTDDSNKRLPAGRS